MLIGSNFVLNAATRRNQFAVHPWAIASNNQRSLDLQFRAVNDGGLLSPIMRGCPAAFARCPSTCCQKLPVHAGSNDGVMTAGGAGAVS